MAEFLERLVLADQQGKLNDFLTYQMLTPHHLAIHAPENEDVPLKEKLQLFTDGLKTLAHKVESEKNFTNLEEVLAFSWAVSKFEPIFKGLGFEVSQDTSHPFWQRLSNAYQTSLIVKPYLHHRIGIDPSLAVMSRRALIKEYGTHPEAEN